jgi:dihydrolipoamide dehydrogenase
MANASRHDLVVIGAGPGGYVAAIRAAQLGLNVACVEKETVLGGTCLRIGCIPSKALLDSSELFEKAKDGLGAHGVKVSGVELDLAAMMRRKDKVVKGLTAGVAALFKKNGVTHVRGAACLVAPGTVSVVGADEGTLSAKNILIATGSEPTPLPGVDFDGRFIVSSEEALSFGEIPPRLLVIGAGAIGLELGSVWARLGSKVKVVEFMDRVVPLMDKELGASLKKILEKQALSFQLSTTAKSASVAGGEVRVTLEAAGKTSIESFDKVLVAIGRRPHTMGLGLEEVGLTPDPKGRVDVDERFATRVAGIYAIGDVIRGPMLAHKAEEEGIACVETLAGRAGHVNYDAIPNVVYTWPEFASVGKTEEECAEQGREVKIGKFPFFANGRARAMEERDGLVKIIADAKTDRLLGVHILGPRASDLIAEGAVAIEFGSSAEDLARTCHAHPTLPEAVKEAALAVAGRSIHI